VQEACDLRVFANVTDAEMVELYLCRRALHELLAREGYNLEIPQALAFGLPVIPSDIPAHREFPITTSYGPTEIVGRMAALADDDRMGKVAGAFAAAIRNVCAEDGSGPSAAGHGLAPRRCPRYCATHPIRRRQWWQQADRPPPLNDLVRGGAETI
jgi:hypothetical protein